MGTMDIIFLIFIIGGILIGGLYFLNKWVSSKYITQQSLIDKTKQTMTIYVIDKKKDYAKNVNLPKIFFEKMPKIYRVMKMNFIKAKVGPQIVTFICDKKVYNAIAPKKNIKVDIAGIYIVSVKGMKTEQELKEIKKQKKQREKEEKKAKK